MENKLQKIYLAYYNLLIVQDFLPSLLSNLVNNLSEGIHRIKCKFTHDDKKCETCRIKSKYCNCFLEYTSFKDDLIEYKCLCCNKNYQHKFDEKLKERFINTHKFSNRVFILIIIFMIGKNSMEDCYLKKKIFTVN